MCAVQYALSQPKAQQREKAKHVSSEAQGVKTAADRVNTYIRERERLALRC